RDVADFRPLERHLWALTEEVSARLKAKKLAGTTVTVKLKTADFKLKTQARSLSHPTQLASLIFSAGRDLLGREVDGTKYRLIGVGVSAITPAGDADDMALIARRAAEAEHAIDRLRERYGDAAVVKGLAFDAEPKA